MGNRYTIFIVLFVISSVISQEPKTYKIRTIAFYNVENIFDTINDPLTFDDDRTPTGKDHWTKERYLQKIKNISKVLSEIGGEDSQTSPDIIGLCEIENVQVINDLIYHPNLREKDYGIIHFDSPDERGVDVALLYKKAVFLPTSFKSIPLILTNSEDFRDYTRDQLVVGGLMDGEEMHFIVNHWPSRSGGEARSKPNRIEAARLNKKIIDSISKFNPDAKIISMGDFNDGPTDDSFKRILKTEGKPTNLASNTLYNPMEALYKKGIGTLAYRDRWNLFDQIYFTANIKEKTSNAYYFWKAGVFKPAYLIDQKGVYKGYPFRTYSGGNYTGGYSDHFPVYIHLLRAVD